MLMLWYYSEGLVRTAFQCLQLVVTDYLPVLPCGCIPHGIDTVAKFARQKQELNVALSAIGLMVSGLIDHISLN